MAASRSGQSGVLAVCHVVLVTRRGSGSVTTLYLPTEAATVQDQTQRHAAVKGNPAQVRLKQGLELSGRPCANVTCGTKSLVPPQWMVTGQNGLSGRSVHVHVVRATEPGSGPAAVLRLSMEAGRVRGRQWTRSCAGSGHVRVRKCICMRRHTHAGKLLNTICNS